MLSTSLSSLGSTPGVLNTNAANSLKTPTSSTPNYDLTLPSTALQAPTSGTTAGLLPGVNTSTQQKTVTSNADGSSTTVHPATSNPSVLAQQQALNKLGAGLVEDGIAGPKTAAAIAKYGNPDSSSSTTGSTTKAPDDPSYQFNTQTGQPNPNYVNPNAPVVSQQTQAQQVNPTTGTNQNNSTTAGAYTPPDQGVNGISQGGLIANAVGQSQAPSQAYIDAQNEANQIQNQETATAQDYAQKTNNIAGTAGFLTQQNGEQGLLNNQYNTVQGALANQYAGATNRLGAANTQQGLQQSALGTAISANQPITGVGYGTQTIDPATGKPITGTDQFGSGPAAAANVQGVQDAQKVINSITSNTPAITTNLQRANDLATQAGLDPNSPLLTGLQHALSTGLITNQALTAFNSTIAALNQNLTDAGQAPLDPSTLTPSALAQLTQTIPNNLKATQQSKQQFISSFNSGSSTSAGASNVQTNSDGTLKAVSF